MSRKIIIPKGVLDDSAQNSIIEIPTKLTRNKGNLIAKRKGNKIVAQQLPDWQDVLSVNNSQGSSNIVATPAGCSRQPEETKTFLTDPSSVSETNSTTYYSARSELSSNFSTLPNMSTHAKSCYKTALEQTPSKSQIEVKGNDLTIETNVESNIQMNESMLANILADTKGSLNTTSASLDDSYFDFNPMLSSTQKSFELSSMYDSSEESDFFFMGAPLSRSQEGKYNVISPMTPSPTKLAAGVNANRTKSLNKTRQIRSPCAQVAKTNQTYMKPEDVPYQTYVRPEKVSNEMYMRPQKSSNQTYMKHEAISNQTYMRPQNASNEMYNRSEALSNQTYMRPQEVSNLYRSPTSKKSAMPASQSILDESAEKTNCSCLPDNTYSEFNPLLSSTQRSFELSSMYDSSDESSYFFMGAPVSRSQDGKYNIISPMTPSPTKLAASVNKRSISQSKPENVADDCACEIQDDYPEIIMSYQSEITEDIYTE